MMRCKKMSLLQWMIGFFLSSAMILYIAAPLAQCAEGETVFSEIAVKKGAPAPDFTLESLLGDQISLKDFKGHLLVIAFAFSKQTAKDIEQYRSRLFSDFTPIIWSVKKIGRSGE